MSEFEKFIFTRFGEGNDRMDPIDSIMIALSYQSASWLERGYCIMHRPTDRLKRSGLQHDQGIRRNENSESFIPLHRCEHVQPY